MNAPPSSTKGFVTGALTTVLILVFLGVTRDRPVLADRESDGRFTYITAGSTLYVIDGANSYMAAYRNEGGSIQLTGGRSLEFDHPHEHLAWYERKDRELTPDVMKDLADRAKKEREKKEKRGK